MLQLQDEQSLFLHNQCNDCLFCQLNCISSRSRKILVPRKGWSKEELDLYPVDYAVIDLAVEEPQLAALVIEPEAQVAEPIDPAAPDLDPVPVLIPVRSYQFKYSYWENSKRREGLLLALY